jgi:hypothetical protein
VRRRVDEDVLAMEGFRPAIPLEQPPPEIIIGFWQLPLGR